MPTSLNCIAFAAAGGTLAFLAGIPAPWLSGGMIMVALVALGGVKVQLDNRLRDTTFVVIGYSMGAGISPETIDKILLWPFSLVLLLACVGGTSVLLTVIFKRGFGWDTATAAFSSIPGAFSYLMAVAAESEAKLGRIAVAQVSRLVVLTALLPSLVSLLPGETAAPNVAPFGENEAPLWDLTWSLGVTALVALVARLLKLPAGALLGSLLASLALHGTGLSEASMPYAVLVVGFVVTGGFVGSKVEGMTLRQILGDVRAGLLTVCVALVLSALFAWAGAELLGLPLALLWLSYAPGGLEVMVILALALGLDPAFVGVHHVVRYIALALLVPIVLRRFLGKTG